MNLQQLELLRISAIEEAKKNADSFLLENSLTGQLFLNHIVFLTDGRVTFQFSHEPPLEITSSVEFV